MKQIIDKNTGQEWIQLDKEELMFGFLSQCIEALAESENCEYTNMLRRLERVDMTEGFILPYYNTLHTESMENVILTLKDLLHKREHQLNK